MSVIIPSLFLSLIFFVVGLIIGCWLDTPPAASPPLDITPAQEADLKRRLREEAPDLFGSTQSTSNPVNNTAME